MELSAISKTRVKGKSPLAAAGLAAAAGPAVRRGAQAANAAAARAFGDDAAKGALKATGNQHPNAKGIGTKHLVGGLAAGGATGGGIYAYLRSKSKRESSSMRTATGQ
jgi:hypothetical protein